MDGWLVHGGDNAKSFGNRLANKSKLRQISWPASVPGMKDALRLYPDQADRLLWHRGTTGLTQAEYAAKTGVKRARYSQWEAGSHQLSLAGARALRKRWGLSLDFTVEGMDETLSMTLRNAWRDRPEVSVSKKSIVKPEE